VASSSASCNPWPKHSARYQRSISQCPAASPYGKFAPSASSSRKSLVCVCDWAVVAFDMYSREYEDRSSWLFYFVFLHSCCPIKRTDHSEFSLQHIMRVNA
jgi:hypothetical protein